MQDRFPRPFLQNGKGASKATRFLTISGLLASLQAGPLLAEVRGLPRAPGSLATFVFLVYREQAGKRQRLYWF